MRTWAGEELKWWRLRSEPVILLRLVYGSCIDCGKFGDVSVKHWLCLRCIAKCRALQQLKRRNDGKKQTAR